MAMPAMAPAPGCQPGGPWLGVVVADDDLPAGWLTVTVATLPPPCVVDDDVDDVVDSAVLSPGDVVTAVVNVGEGEGEGEGDCAVVGGGGLATNSPEKVL
jgi:hypothetical protein